MLVFGTLHKERERMKVIELQTMQFRRQKSKKLLLTFWFLCIIIYLFFSLDHTERKTERRTS